jgi:hypothetical protein
MDDTEVAMLAEIFLLRLEAIARFSKDVAAAPARFVPFDLAQFKNRSNNRRSKDT